MYDRSIVEGLLSQWENNGNGYVNIKYTGYTSTEVTTVKKTTISGSLTNTLKLASDAVGIQTAQCKITSATATNSPVWTDTVNFVATTTADEYLLILEGIGIGVTASLATINLANGEVAFETSQSQVSSGGITKYFSFLIEFFPCNATFLHEVPNKKTKNKHLFWSSGVREG